MGGLAEGSWSRFKPWPKEPVLRLDLTVRGAPGIAAFKGVADFLDEGRSTIVHGIYNVNHGTDAGDLGTREMTALATSHNFIPTVDTIIAGLSVAYRDKSWAERSALGLEEPARENLSDPEQPWLRTVLQQIKSIAALTKDWDSYGAGPIRRDVLWYALRLMQSVMDDHPAPQLTPMSHEGILLEWHRNSVHLEIEIENAGEAYVSYENGKTGTDDVVGGESRFYVSLRAPAGP